MADAQRAAGALADAGVNCVLLYGSVARGDQAPGSDIDLLAVYDDLDYTQRPKLRDRLEKLASQAAGFDVQVSPTDRPEWRHRSELMRTTFERGVAAEIVILFDHEPVDVTWNKQIGLPSMDIQEAIKSLWNAHGSLSTLERALPATPIERRKLAAHYTGDSPLHRSRYARISGAGYDAIEHALRALIHATGDTPVADLRRQSDLQRHRVHKMVDYIRDESRRRAEHILDSIAADTGNIPNFHSAGNYLAEVRDPVDARYPTMEKAESITQAALDMTRLAITTIQETIAQDGPYLSPEYLQMITDTQDQQAETAQVFSTTNLQTGQPHTRHQA